MTANSAFLGTLYAQMGVNTTALDHAIVKMRMFDAASTKALTSVSAKLAATGGVMKTFGRSLTQFVTLPMSLVGGAAIKMYADFEFSMNKVVSLVGVARKQVDEWSTAVLALGPSVGKSPRELADAMYFITSAGIRGKESMEILEESAKSSASGLGEVKVVADLLTSAMNAYGKENLSAAQANDVLTATVKEGKAEADLLAQSMGLVLPIASAMGATFDQVGAATAAMTRTGTKAATAAIQLRQIFNSLLKPAKEAEDALGHMGTSGEELRKMVREEGLLAALEKLKQISEEYGIDMLGKVIPNIRSLTGVLDIMGENVEENRIIFEAIKNSAGDANRMFEETADTIRFRLNQAFGRVQKSLVILGKSLSKILVPVLESVAMWIENLAARFDGLEEAQKKLIITIGAVLAALGPLVTILGFLAGNVLPMVIRGFTLLKGKAIGLGTSLLSLGKFLVAAPWLTLAAAVGIAAVALADYATKAKRAAIVQNELYKRGVDFDEMAEEEKQAILKRLHWTGFKKKMLILDAIAEEVRVNKLEDLYGRSRDLLGQFAVFEQERMGIIPTMDTRQLEDARAMLVSYGDRVEYELARVRSVMKENESNWVNIDFTGEKALEKGTKKLGAGMQFMVDMYGSAQADISELVEDANKRRQWSMHETSSAVAIAGQKIEASLVQERKDIQIYVQAVEDAMQREKDALANEEAIEEIKRRSAAFNEVVNTLESQMHVIAVMEKLTGDQTQALEGEVNALTQALSSMAALTQGETGPTLKEMQQLMEEWANLLSVTSGKLEIVKGDITTLNDVMLEMRNSLEVAAVMQRAFGNSFDMTQEKLHIFANALDTLVTEGVQGAEEEIEDLISIIGWLQYKLDKGSDMKFMKDLGDQIRAISDYAKAGIITPFEKALMDFETYSDALDRAKSSGASVEYIKWLEESLADAWDSLSIGQKVETFVKANQKQLRMIAQNFRQLWGGIGDLIEANMAKEIAAMEKLAKRRNKSDEWVAKEREKIEKKYSKKRKAMMIAEAIAGVALAIINALQSKPFLPLGLIAAGIAAAAGAVQIAAIQAAPMAKGGIIPPGFPNDSFPALLTSGEKVIPAHSKEQDQMNGEVVFRIEGDELVGILKKRESVAQNY
jgi:TP901 family phage tail tape measure protein